VPLARRTCQLYKRPRAFSEARNSITSHLRLCALAGGNVQTLFDLFIQMVHQATTQWARSPAHYCGK
jgi:hypothetical protein